MQLLYLLGVPVVIALLNLLIFNKKVNFVEAGLQILVICGLMAGLAFGCSAEKKHDTEILNGHVTSKQRNEVHCRHSYPCHCYTYNCGTSKCPMTCTQCDTCYEHSFDVDWDVYATCGMYQESFSVETLDAQGLQEPPRWTAFKPGDPFMEDHGYDNYVKANADTIYKTHGYQDKYAKFIPGYPSNIYDYHTHLDRMIMVGTSLPDLQAWNDALTALNCEIGPEKQCNIMMLVTSGQPEEYYYAIKEAWIGGKKNDIIVMIDVSPDGHINWTNTLSWAKDDLVRVKLRDDILAINKMDRAAILAVIHDDVKGHFIRKRMREFKYLDKAIILTDSEFIWMLVTAILLSIAASVFIDVNDINGGSHYNY